MSEKEQKATPPNEKASDDVKITEKDQEQSSPYHDDVGEPVVEVVSDAEFSPNRQSGRFRKEPSLDNNFRVHQFGSNVSSKKKKIDKGFSFVN